MVVIVVVVVLVVLMLVMVVGQMPCLELVPEVWYAVKGKRLGLA